MKCTLIISKRKIRKKFHLYRVVKILDDVNSVILIERWFLKNPWYIFSFCDSSAVAGPLNSLTFQKHTSNICGIVGLTTSLINWILLQLWSARLLILQMFCVNRCTGRNAPVGKGPDPAVYLVAPGTQAHVSGGLHKSMSSECVGLFYFTSGPRVSANADIFFLLATPPLTLISELSTTVDFFPDGIPKCP